MYKFYRWCDRDAHIVEWIFYRRISWARRHLFNTKYKLETQRNATSQLTLQHYTNATNEPMMNVIYNRWMHCSSGSSSGNHTTRSKQPPCVQPEWIFALNSVIVVWVYLIQYALVYYFIEWVHRITIHSSGVCVCIASHHKVCLAPLFNDHILHIELLRMLSISLSLPLSLSPSLSAAFYYEQYEYIVVCVFLLVSTIAHFCYTNNNDWRLL